MFLIFSVSCNKSVCMNVQGDPRARKKGKKKGIWKPSGDCMAKTATLEQSAEHVVSQTVLNMKTVVDEKSLNTGSSCMLARGEVQLTAVNDVGIKCSNFPDTHERHVPSSSIMTPRLPPLQLHLFSYNSLHSVSHWTHSSTNQFLGLQRDTGKSEVIPRPMCSVCSDLKG